MDRIENINHMANKLTDVRIVRLPAMKVLSSVCQGEGAPEGDTIMPMLEWLKDRGITGINGMREAFMFNNPEKGCYVMIVRIPESFGDIGPFGCYTFPGGLFAVTSAYVYEINERMGQLEEWLQNNDRYELEVIDGKARHPYMGEVITPWDLVEQFGEEQQDLFVPIRVKV